MALLVTENSIVNLLPKAISYHIAFYKNKPYSVYFQGTSEKGCGKGTKDNDNYKKAMQNFINPSSYLLGMNSFSSSYRHNTAVKPLSIPAILEWCGLDGKCTHKSVCLNTCPLRGCAFWGGYWTFGRRSFYGGGSELLWVNLKVL